MANIIWIKDDIDNRQGPWESTEGRLRCPEISWTLILKRLRIEPEFLPTLSILFRPQSIVHSLSGINMSPHGECKWNVGRP